MTKIEELSIEQLMGIASTDKEVISTLFEDKSNVRDFLREYGVTDGDALVPNYKVYYDYCKKWKPTGKKLSKIGFLRKLSIVFRTKRTNNTRYYLLNEGVFDLSEDALNEAKKFDERYRRKVAKKGIKKIESEVPSTSEEIQSEDASGLY